MEAKVWQRKSFGISLTVINVLSETLKPNPFGEKEKLDISDLELQGLCHISEISEDELQTNSEMFKNCSEGTVVFAMIHSVDSDSRNLTFTLKQSQLAKNLSHIKLGPVENKEEEKDQSEKKGEEIYSALFRKQQVEDDAKKFNEKLERSKQFKNPHSLLCLIHHFEIVENFSIVKPKRAKKKEEKLFYFEQLRTEQNKVFASSK